MNVISNIILFIKRLFRKQNNIKMLESPVEKVKKEDKTNFINSLKVNIEQNKKKNIVETLTCVGDGLGIKPKINC